MIDEIYDRGYQAARTQLNGGVTDAFSGLSKTIGDSMRVLHRLDWSAPWNAPSKKTRRA